MVGVAQWLRRLAVAQQIEGSNPFAHPSHQHRLPSTVGGWRENPTEDTEGIF